MTLHLSRLVLNPVSRQTRGDLRNLYEMHRTLSRAFDQEGDGYEAARCLFRVEEHPAPARVLVQSRLLPDWGALPEGYLAQDAEVKELTLRFREDQLLRFLLLANPTRREPARQAVHAGTGKPKDGSRRALVFQDEAETDAACRDWLKRKGEHGGFLPLRFQVEDRGVIAVTKGGGRFPYAAIRFEGELRITDPERFAETLSGGIGTAKGFGFGLLSVGPAR